jgi:hypothetical protein
VPCIYGTRLALCGRLAPPCVYEDWCAQRRHMTSTHTQPSLYPCKVQAVCLWVISQGEGCVRAMTQCTHPSQCPCKVHTIHNIVL